jgi:hypothetical protein
MPRIPTTEIPGTPTRCALTDCSVDSIAAMLVADHVDDVEVELAEFAAMAVANAD